MSTTTGRPRLSAFQQVQQQFDDYAQAGLAKVSKRDLKSIITWLESLQLHIALSVATDDDALSAAKGRGKIEGLIEINERLWAEISGRKEAAESEKETTDA
jgi:hypothetical protein